MHSRVQSYITQIRQVFDGSPWLNETFSKKLDNISAQQAFSQSPEGHHSVAEVVSHVIEWRKEVTRRLADNSSERKLTEGSPNDWKPVKELQQIGWSQLYDDLKQTQQKLLKLLENKDDSYLDEQLGDTEFNKEYFLAGLLHHDLYHLGQIGLILKWTSSK